MLIFLVLSIIFIVLYVKNRPANDESYAKLETPNGIVTTDFVKRNGKFMIVNSMGKNQKTK